MLMVQALKDPAYNVNIAACEFWSGVVSQWLFCFDETDPDAHVKLEKVKLILPEIIPTLLACCRISDADKMEIMATNEADCLEERFGGSGKNEEEEEEDYEVKDGRYNTTLRKSACYTLQ